MLEAIQSALGTRQATQPTLDISIDDTLAMLKNSRRRHVIDLAADATGTITVRNVTEEIAAHEHGKPSHELNSQDRKRVYVSLIQHHLEKLANAGLIEYNEDAKTIATTWRTQPVADLTATVADHHGGDA